MHTRSGRYGVKRKAGNSKFDGRGKKAKDALVISDNESSENDGSKNGCSSNEETVVISSKMMKKKANLVISDNRDEDQTENQVEQLTSKKKGKQTVIGKSVKGKVRTKGGKSVSSRTIMAGRAVNFMFFDTNGFENFRKWFSAQSLDKFAEIREPYFPRLVREFYSNMKITSMPNMPTVLAQLNSTVQGIDICVDSALLSSILELPRNGFSDYQTHGWISCDGFVSHNAVKLLVGKDDISPKFKPTESDLTLEFKVLHNMLYHIFLPRKGGRDHVSCYEIFFMWAIATGFKLSFPHIMLSYMAEARRSSKKILPYGMVLTQIFQHFKINTKEAERVSKSDIHVYSAITMDMIGYEKQGTTWVKKTMSKAEEKRIKKAAREKKNGDSSLSQLLPQPSSPPSAPSSSMDMLAEIMNTLIELKREVNEVKENQEHVLHQLKEMKEELKLLKEPQSHTFESS